MANVPRRICIKNLLQKCRLFNSAEKSVAKNYGCHITLRVNRQTFVELFFSICLLLNLPKVKNFREVGPKIEARAQIWRALISTSTPNSFTHVVSTHVVSYGVLRVQTSNICSITFLVGRSLFPCSAFLSTCHAGASDLPTTACTAIFC